MTALETLMTNGRLTQAVTEACTAALKAGLSKEDVIAVLARIQELLENSDD